MSLLRPGAYLVNHILLCNTFLYVFVFLVIHILIFILLVKIVFNFLFKSHRIYKLTLIVIVGTNQKNKKKKGEKLDY